jgi:class 3 adenylate cyclase/predicted ATPase
VLFCDLVSSTEFSARMDPENWRDVISQYEEMCARAIHRFDGFLAQRQGDGIVAYFGYPVAHEDASERAIRAALQIVETIGEVDAGGATLQVRIGIATGLVVVSEVPAEQSSAVGPTMNLAARLQTAAEPGSIVIADNTRRLAGARFTYEELGEHSLKGIATPVRIWRVAHVSDVEGRFDAATVATLSPLVGREPELAVLRQRWERAREGHGQAVLLWGEAGIGKSRILHALRERLGARASVVVRFQCSPYFTNSAFHPFNEYLERLLSVAKDESGRAALDGLDALVAGNRTPLLDAALFASLLSLPVRDRYPPLELAPVRQKEETMRAIVETIAATASRQPTLMLFEDLHWAGPTTMQVLDRLVERMYLLPMLLIVTSRPDLPLRWTALEHVTTLSIARFTRAESAQLVQGVAGNRISGPALDLIVSKTDGVPLYVEELTRALLESSAFMVRCDDDAGGETVPAVPIPETLRDSLMARLDRLAPAKGVAQLGAVLGREFSVGMLRAIANMPDPQLDHALARLTHAGLIVPQGSEPEVSYAFKHALIRDAAYDSLLKSSRQQMHKTIASVLEERFAAIRDTKPELLAHHLTEAGLFDRAVPYWYEAGKKAVERSADLEGINHLKKGLELLKELPEGIERDRRELLLQTLLGNALMLTQGYAAPQVGSAFARARELCERVGETPQAFPVLRGLWLFYLVRAELSVARSIAEHLEQLAERAADPGLVLESDRALGVTCFYLGEFDSAWKHLHSVLALYDSERHRSHAFLYQADPAVASYSYGSTALWILGMPQQALARLQQGLHLADSCKHAFSRAYALFHAALLYQLRQEIDLARQYADAGIEQSKQGFPLWLAMAQMVRGWTQVEEGLPENGLDQMQQGFALYRKTGARVADTYTFWLLADACIKSGHHDEASKFIREGQEASKRTGERVFEAELHRLMGELTLHSSTSSARLTESETCFGQALDVARGQGAQAFELRAATSMARVLDELGRGTEARTLLADTYARFSEGFDTRDLESARSVLEALT